ncbi:MAG: hypothetical protein JWP57_3912 [Spirosoma sp.]|nr:hypothetical protein [Spirosoma sp.]
MSLEEELAINQFGQGVRSVADLLDEFSQLDEDQKRKCFVHFYYYIWYFKLDASDVEQAMADCAIKATDPTYDYLNLHLIKAGRKGMICISDAENHPKGGLDKPYELLLRLFKVNYQRCFELEKENLSKWWYWDLSSEEVSQGILTRHKELLDEVYSHPSFRCEFVSMAKLYYKNNTENQASYKEPSSEQQTNFNFVTYDQMTVDLLPIGNKYYPAIWLIRNAVENALSKRYQLDPDLARRLTLDVIERHLQETYNSTLFQDVGL